MPRGYAADVVAANAAADTRIFRGDTGPATTRTFRGETGSLRGRSAELPTPPRYEIEVLASADGWSTPGSNAWSLVLKRRGQTATIGLGGGGPAALAAPAQLESWYQNMEAAPSRSRVASYLVRVSFCLPRAPYRRRAGTRREEGC